MPHTMCYIIVKELDRCNIMKNEFLTGKLNKLTDVPGVTVGHKTVDSGDIHSGVTVINPIKGNVCYSKPTAACYVLNGYGKSVGLIQIEELGTLESPIALTNTLSVGAVMDAVTRRAVRICAKEGKSLRSVNTVVCECNDGGINDICAFGINAEHVEEAFGNACEDFAEGAVGAGRGMTCHGLKGGIGSASRIVKLDGTEYTVGVLVLTNHGAARDLTVDGVNVGADIQSRIKENDKGSVIVIMATDIPLTPRQIKRSLKRIPTALARIGSRVGHGSGEVFVGFSTGNIINAHDKSDIVCLKQINENKIDTVFRAVSEATEDAVLKSMLLSDPCINLKGTAVHSLSEYM